MASFHRSRLCSEPQRVCERSATHFNTQPLIALHLNLKSNRHLAGRALWYPDAECNSAAAYSCAAVSLGPCFGHTTFSLAHMAQ